MIDFHDSSWSRSASPCSPPSLLAALLPPRDEATERVPLGVQIHPGDPGIDPDWIAGAKPTTVGLINRNRQSGFHREGPILTTGPCSPSASPTTSKARATGPRPRSSTRSPTWSGWPTASASRYAWFAEHHAHAHHGHLPTPLLFALHLAGRTRQIRLGTAIVCLNLHHPLDVAEQVAVADVLTGGRLAAGFGSGSTPEEFRLFGLAEADEAERHARFEEPLRIIRSAWGGGADDPGPPSRPGAPPPGPAGPVLGRREQRRLGPDRRGDGLQHALLPPADAGAIPRSTPPPIATPGGAGLIAANRPVFVGPDDATAFALAEPALRTLWRRFRARGQDPRRRPPSRATPTASAATRSTSSSAAPSRVARQLLELHAQAPSTSPTSKSAGRACRTDSSSTASGG